jgi:hypothetical protein
LLSEVTFKKNNAEIGEIKVGPEDQEHRHDQARVNGSLP